MNQIRNLDLGRLHLKRVAAVEHYNGWAMHCCFGATLCMHVDGSELTEDPYAGKLLIDNDTITVMLEPRYAHAVMELMPMVLRILASGDVKEADR